MTMDFLFSGFVKFTNINGKMTYIDASKLVAIEQNNYDDNLCYVEMNDGNGLRVPMSAENFVREVEKVREKAIQRLTSLN